MNELIYSKYGLTYEVDDVLNMKYNADSFDIIIEKGLLDSLLCKKECDQDINKMMKEIYRVLSNKGIYISVSHGDPKRREIYFDRNQWEFSYEIPSIQLEIESENIGKEKKKTQEKISEFYVYIVKKR